MWRKGYHEVRAQTPASFLAGLPLRTVLDQELQYTHAQMTNARLFVKVGAFIY